jgi:hypothetical protein
MQGSIPSSLNLALDLPQSEWFRQANVLHLREASEPEAVLFNMVGIATVEQVRSVLSRHAAPGGASALTALQRLSNGSPKAL